MSGEPDEPAESRGTPAKKERPPLNPAYAILVGAVVTATAGIGAAVLNIRSSERLSKERDRTEAAAARESDLRTELDQLSKDLETAQARIEALTGTTALTIPTSATVVPGTVAPAATVGTAAPPSIVVVIPTNLVSPLPDRPVSVPTATTVPLPVASTTSPATTVPVTTSTTVATTTTSPATVVSSVAPTSVAVGAAGGGGGASTSLSPTSTNAP
jgi:hypothetical protein